LKPPSLVHYKTEGEYQKHFEREYCSTPDPILTFDGIKVDFYPGQFKHAFFKSSSRKAQDKTNFCRTRAERMNWIKFALQNPKADLRVGYDKRTKSSAPHRRVAVVEGNYVVVIQLKSSKKAFFITAFSADSSTLAKIKQNPRWK
jgi:hypothetical protein